MARIAVAEIWTFRAMPGIDLESVDLTGFKVEATDGSIGKVDEATYDTGSSYLVVDTGPWILGRKVMLPAGVIDRIDSDEERIYVDLTKDEIKLAEFDPEQHRDDSVPGPPRRSLRPKLISCESRPGWSSPPRPSGFDPSGRPPCRGSAIAGGLTRVLGCTFVKLVLASRSPRRREILGWLGVFEAVEPEVEELKVGLDPEGLVLETRRKAAAGLDACVGRGRRRNGRAGRRHRRLRRRGDAGAACRSGRGRSAASPTLGPRARGPERTLPARSGTPPASRGAGPGGPE